MSKFFFSRLGICILSALRYLVDVLDCIVGIIFILFFPIRFVIGDIPGWIALISSILPVILFPAIPICVLAIARKRPFTRVWSLICVAVLLLSYAPRLRPHSDLKSFVETPNIVLLSHNVGQNLLNYNEFSSLIQKYNPDIVVLQEITASFIADLQPKFDKYYQYKAYGPLQSERQVGMGILSRYPLTNLQNFKLDDEGLVFQQRVEVDFEGQQIVVYNIHTTFPWINWQTVDFGLHLSVPEYDDQVRRREIQRLIELLETETSPVILAGDFNFSDFSGDYQLINSQLDDSYIVCGFGMGFTWPSNNTPAVKIPVHEPLVRLDYVFVSSEFAPKQALVLSNTGSDHRPLLVELSLHASETSYSTRGP